MKSIKSLIDLNGRVALITGGSGYLGKVIANALAEMGCSICLVDKANTLNSALDEIKLHTNTKVLGLDIDLEYEENRKKIPSLIEDHFGRLDILVNNAAFVGDNNLSGWATNFENQELSSWRKALEVNLTAAFHLSQLLSPLLKISENGSIINIGSIYGVVGPDLKLYEDTKMANPAAYAASKGGLIQLTRWLSTVLAPNIRVNCISPGGIKRRQPIEFIERYISKTPLRRMGTEEDLKGAVVFFASDLSSYVTGENLMVDGGWTVW